MFNALGAIGILIPWKSQSSFEFARVRNILPVPPSSERFVFKGLNTLQFTMYVLLPLEQSLPYQADLAPLPPAVKCGRTFWYTATSQLFEQSSPKEANSLLEGQETPVSFHDLFTAARYSNLRGTISWAYWICPIQSRSSPTSWIHFNITLPQYVYCYIFPSAFFFPLQLFLLMFYTYWSLPALLDLFILIFFDVPHYADSCIYYFCLWIYKPVWNTQKL
jgi:hypothetical protein